MKSFRYNLKKILKFLPKTVKAFILEHWSIFYLEDYKKVKSKIDTYTPLYTKFDSLEDTKRLLRKIAFSGKKGIITCNHFCDEQLKQITDNDLKSSNLIVICVVKNELGRIARWLEYYRKIGVKSFAIFDDNSTDGTREYLIKQHDVEVFVGTHDYTTIDKIVWVNMIVAIYGYNKWYLIVDSDEFFTYQNMENIKIDKYVKTLKSNNELIEASMMLDMYSDGNIFSVSSRENYEKKCCYFDNCDYYIKKTAEAHYIVGGVRKRIFDNTDFKCLPVLSKKSLMFMNNNTFVYTAHTIFPFKYNYLCNFKSILRHYKFLKEDYNNYVERVAKNNFYNASSEYKAYLELYKRDSSINLKNANSFKWDGSKSINKIEIAEEMITDK